MERTDPVKARFASFKCSTSHGAFGGTSIMMTAPYALLRAKISFSATSEVALYEKQLIELSSYIRTLLNLPPKLRQQPSLCLEMCNYQIRYRLFCLTALWAIGQVQCF